MSYDYGFAARGGGGAAPAPPPAAPQRAPSGGGGGGGLTPRITPSVGGGGAVARPQKTEVMNHAQQSAIGGPGAMPSGGGIGHMQPGHDIGGARPNIGEHIGAREGDNRVPSQRDERGHPDQFRNFDQRFDRDRDRLGNTFWRTAFTDYDRDRFLPLIGQDPWLYHIFGINYYPELLQYAIPYYPTTCGPWGTGMWVIGADSRWYPLRHHHQLNTIRQIEAQRMIGSYAPVIVPNCGGGVLPAYQPITPYPAYPTYPAVAPAYPPVSYPYTT